MFDRWERPETRHVSGTMRRHELPVFQARLPNTSSTYDLKLTGPSSRRERPTRLVSKAEASEWASGSIFCSREPDRQSAQLPSVDGSLQTKGESSARMQATARRRASTRLRKFPSRGGLPREPA